MGNKNFEIRSFSGAAAPTIKGRTVSGYAIVFNSYSEVMVDWNEGKRFKEMIAPGAVTEAMLGSSDIKMLLEHNRERLLARSKQGKGTLNYWITQKGVAYRFEAPNTKDGDFAVEMLKRGDLSGSSFSFVVAKDGVWWDHQGKDYVRVVTKIDRLHDFSIVSDPAYSESSSDVRSALAKGGTSSPGWKQSLTDRAGRAGIELKPEKKSGYWRSGLDKLKKRL